MASASRRRWWPRARARSLCRPISPRSRMAARGEDRVMRQYHGAADGWREAAEAVQPAGRLLKPAEVARAVAYLASAESGMMTGSIIDFDQSVAGCYESPPLPAPLA